MPARLRIDFLRRDLANANPQATAQPCRNGFKNSFPFFGDDWLKTGGIGEFTGGGPGGTSAPLLATGGERKTMR